MARLLDGCVDKDECMHITMTTPAILFPTVSLLMVAYTNRYLALAKRIRGLHQEYRDMRAPELLAQIRILRRRVRLIRLMQASGVIALLLCVSCMLLLLVDFVAVGEVVFGGALLLLIASLSVSLYEVTLSVKALDIALADIEESIELSSREP